MALAWAKFVLLVVRGLSVVPAPKSLIVTRMPHTGSTGLKEVLMLPSSAAPDRRSETGTYPPTHVIGASGAELIRL